MVVMVKGFGLVFFAIGPLQPLIGVRDTSKPAASNLTRVPQKANEVLSDPVLFLIASFRNRVPEQEQGLSPGFGGSVALTNSRSPDVQEVGKVCASTVVVVNKVRRRVHRIFQPPF
jgi:hypothetical protein